MKQINYTGSSKLISRIVSLLNRKVPLPLDGDGNPDWGTNRQFLTTDGAGGTYWSPGGGGGGAEIIFGTSDPTSQQGADGDLYIKYINGVGIPAIYGKKNNDWLAYGLFFEYVWDFTISMNAINNGTAATLSGSASRSQSGVSIYGQNGYINIPAYLLQTGYTYEIHIASLNMQVPGSNNRLFMFSDTNTHNAGFVWRGATGRWGVWDSVNTWQESSITDKDYFDDSVLKIKITTDGKWHIYKDDVLIFEPANAIPLKNIAFVLGAETNNCYNVTISKFKVYPNGE